MDPTAGPTQRSTTIDAIDAPAPFRRAFRLTRNWPMSSVDRVIRSMNAATAFVAGVTPLRICENTYSGRVVVLARTRTS